jgi:acetylornithine deacetylase
MRTTLGAEKAGTASATMIGDSLLRRKYLVPFLLACIILACNQATGVNSIIAYNTNILLQSGLSDFASHWAYVVFTVVNFAMTFVGVALVDRKGRKFLLALGSAGIIAALVSTAALFYRSERLRVDSKNAVQSLVTPDQKLRQLYTEETAHNLLERGPEGDSARDRYASSLAIIYSCGDFRGVTNAVRSDDVVVKPIEVSRESCLPNNKVVAFFSNPLGNLAVSRGGNLTIEHALISPLPSSRHGWLVAFTLFGFIAFYALGPGVCVWLALSELMPTRIRSNGMSIALLLNQAVSTSIAAIFLPTVGKYGYSTMFIGFAVCTSVYLITAVWFLPETKGKTLGLRVGMKPAKQKLDASAAVLREFLRYYGVRTELYDTSFVVASGHRFSKPGRHYEGRKNLTARLSGSGRGKSLLLNGHMDTVPPARGAWRFTPWSGTRQKGRVYGLGSFDMKAGLAAQAAVLCALKRAGLQLGGDLACESVVDEEWGGGGGSLAARFRDSTFDGCVISEATQLEIYRATRGGYVVDLRVEAGDPSGYFSKKEVVSPALPLGRLLKWVESWVGRRRTLKSTGAYAHIPDPAPVQVLAVESNRLESDVPYSVPLYAGVRLYFQFLPEENQSKVIREIRRSLLEFQRADPFFRSYPIRWTPLLDGPLLGHEVPHDHVFTKTMVKSAQTSLRKKPVVTAAPYPCDAFLVHREFGIPTLLFGPCGGGAHNVDEYVDIESVMDTARVLTTLALEWCRG